MRQKRYGFKEKQKGNASLVYTMRNKKRNSLSYTELKTQNFRKLLLGTYCMPSNLLITRDTKVTGTWLLLLKLTNSKEVQEANDRNVW